MVKPLFPSSKPAATLPIVDKSPQPLFPIVKGIMDPDIEQYIDDQVKANQEEGYKERWAALKPASSGGTELYVPYTIPHALAMPKQVIPERPLIKVQAGKVLFPERAVMDSIDDLPVAIKTHPCIVEMTNKDVRRAYILSNLLKPDDTKALFSYGDERRELFAEVVNKIVEAAKQSKLQTANDYLMELCNDMTSIDITKVGQNPKKGIFEWFVSHDQPPSLAEVMKAFDKTCINIVSGLSKIKLICNDLLAQVQDLDVLYKTNQDSFNLLQIEIAAGLFFITQAIPVLAAIKPANAFDGNDIAYKKMCMERFANKISDLEMTAQSVLTNAPQIRLMQLNIQDLAERSKNVGLGFSKWKSQFMSIVTALQNESSRTKSNDFSMLLQKQSGLLQDFTLTQQALKKI